MKKIIYLALLCAFNAQALQILQPKDGHETVKQKTNWENSSEAQLSPTLSPEQLLAKLEKLAKSGDPRAQFSLANMYHDGINVKEDTKLAFYWYSQVAEQGYASAQFNVANGYYHGIGVDIDFNKARAWYESAAEQEFIAAQYNLAVMYRRGEGGDVDNEKAYYWYEKAGLLGYPQAQLILAKLNESGIGVEKSLEAAENWYLKAVSESSQEAQFYLAEYYQRAGKFDEALGWYEKSAKQNNPTAQFNLAEMLRLGEGTEVDYSKSIYWYEIAAESGHEKAQLSLDELRKKIVEDIKTQKDHENEITEQEAQSNFQMQFDLARSFEKVNAGDKAIEIYKQLAEQGFIPAQSYLAALYRRGYLIKQDDFKALHWALTAAEKGDAEAQFLSGVIYRKSSKVAPDIDAANYWYHEAAGNGHTEAQYNLATLYLNGRGVEKNTAKAIELFNDAASKGHINAQYSLALRFLRGEGIEQNYPRAVELLLEASKGGHVLAQYSLALRYQLGQGIEVDPEQAIFWYQQSADQENSEAQYQLYKIFNSGDITEKSEDLSLMYLIRAAENEHSAAQQVLSEITADKEKNLIDETTSMQEISSNTDTEINTTMPINDDQQSLTSSIQQSLMGALMEPEKVAKPLFIDKNSVFIPNQEEIANSLNSNSQEMTNLERLVLRAKQGNPIALHNLSTLFTVGALVHKDDRKAFKLMQEAAILGLTKSQNSLAIMYMNGKGVEADLNKALYWARSSAQKGDNRGRQILLILMQNIN